MDLDSQFKDLDLSKNVEPEKKVVPEVPPVNPEPVAAKILPTTIIDDNKSLEKISDFSESEQIAKNIGMESLADLDEDLNQKYLTERTTFEKIFPFILPIILTTFALFITGYLIYFFTKNQSQISPPAITNNGDVQDIPATTTPIVVVDDIQPVVATPTPEIIHITLTDGTTTIMNLKFSYDKYNYDNYPRGIYMNADQIFDGSYENYKIIPTNRAYANDYFFGRDRNMVSLLGNCSYVIDNAQVLVSNVQNSEGDQIYSAIKNKYFRGKIEKVISSSKPRIVCDETNKEQ